MASEYENLQSNKSHNSRNSLFGARLIDSVERYYSFFLEGEPVLDVGCNDGLGMEQIQKHGFEVIGVDISRDRIMECTERGLKVFRGRQEYLPLKDKEVGTVFSSHTLEHSDNIKKALMEYKRVAKRAVIIVPIEKVKKNPAHFSTINSPEDLKEYIKHYKIVHEESLNRLEDEYVVIVDF